MLKPQKLSKNENTNLLIIVRFLDEVDFLGIVYSSLTKEMEFSKDSDYNYKDLVYSLKRIELKYGSLIKKKVLRFIDMLEKKYYSPYDFGEKKLINQVHINKMPIVDDKFNYELLLKEMRKF